MAETKKEDQAAAWARGAAELPMTSIPSVNPDTVDQFWQLVMAVVARNSATSASTAWVSSARAPLRRISVRESVKAPGWASLMTLLSDTAYHSFIGEVEALNTTTIRRLTRSRRHQLLAIALPSVRL